MSLPGQIKLASYYGFSYVRTAAAAVPKAARTVFTTPKYVLISLSVALFVIAINIGSVNYRLYFSRPGFDVASKVFIGTFSTIPVGSVVLLVVAAALTGMLFSLLSFHLVNLKSVGGSYYTGAGGAFLGIVAPACASCGIGLVALFGLTGLLGSLPFSGREFSLLGILLLFIAIGSVSKKIQKRTCGILS